MLVLIALNGIFVAGEFSLVAVDIERVEVMAEQGHRRARVVRKLLSRLSFHLGGAQLGITVTSLLLGFLAEDTIGAVLDFLPGVSLSPGPTRAVIAIAIAAVLQMIFGELVPKNLAISRPLGTGLWLGSSKQSVATFSFLLSVPTILAASVIGISTAAPMSQADVGDVLAGSVMAFIVGYIAIQWLMRWLQNDHIWMFSLYCFPVGLGSIAIWIWV